MTDTPDLKVVPLGAKAKAEPLNDNQLQMISRLEEALQYAKSGQINVMTLGLSVRDPDDDFDTTMVTFDTRVPDVIAVIGMGTYIAHAAASDYRGTMQVDAPTLVTPDDEDDDT